MSYPPVRSVRKNKANWHRSLRFEAARGRSERECQTCENKANPALPIRRSAFPGRLRVRNKANSRGWPRTAQIDGATGNLIE